jgi:Cu/Ag efflux protein CusF
MRVCKVKWGKFVLFAAWIGLALASGRAAAQAPPANAAARVIGGVTQIARGHLTLRADNGSDVQVQLPDDVEVLRVPPGAKDLKTATKITLGDIAMGDRVLVIGHPGDGPNAINATRVMVMTKADLASLHAAEAEDWQRRGINGVVKAVDPATKQITIAVPNTPPTPGNPTHPVILTVAPDTKLLRYAPDSVNFSDAKPSAFEAIMVGDQVRGLGTKSDDGTHFALEKLVSGKFRNIGATVISVDAQAGSVTVKDLSTGKPLVVHLIADSKIRELPPMLAQRIAMLNAPAGDAGGGGRGGAPGGGGGGRGAGGPGGPGGGGGGQRGGGMGNVNAMIERMPTLQLTELKSSDPIIVVCTEGAKPSEVTAITILTGVEPILAARPKGGEMNLGNWNLGTGMGGGSEGGGGEQQGPQ